MKMVAITQRVSVDPHRGERRDWLDQNWTGFEVNSYHRWGARETCDALEVWARAEDGVIEAVRHNTRPMLGVMWHPERRTPYADSDISMFSRFFGEV